MTNEGLLELKVDILIPAALAFDSVWQMSQEKKITLRKAAYVLALQRLSEKATI